MGINKKKEEIKTLKKMIKELTFLFQETSRYDATKPFLKYIRYFNNNEIEEMRVEYENNKILILVEEISVLADMNGFLTTNSFEWGKTKELLIPNEAELEKIIEKYSKIESFADFKKWILKNISYSTGNTINIYVGKDNFKDRYEELMYNSIVQKVSDEDEKVKYIYSIIKELLKRTIKLQGKNDLPNLNNLIFFIPFFDLLPMNEEFGKFFLKCHEVSLTTINEKIEELEKEIKNIQKRYDVLLKFFIFILTIATTSSITAWITVIIEGLFKK